MQIVKIRNVSNSEFIPIQAWDCQSFFSRFRGLMFKRSLAENEGALLVEKTESRLGTSIHMLFMFFDLGIVWINRQNLVVDTKLARKWQLSSMPEKPAKLILEIHPNRLKDFSIGDKIQFDHE